MDKNCVNKFNVTNKTEIFTGRYWHLTTNFLERQIIPGGSAIKNKLHFQRIVFSIFKSHAQECDVIRTPEYEHCNSKLYQVSF